MNAEIIIAALLLIIAFALVLALAGHARRRARYERLRSGAQQSDGGGGQRTASG